MSPPATAAAPVDDSLSAVTEPHEYDAAMEPPVTWRPTRPPASASLLAVGLLCSAVTVARA